MAVRKKTSPVVLKKSTVVGKGNDGRKTTKAPRLTHIIAGIFLIALIGGYFFVFQSFAATGDTYRWVPGSKGVKVSSSMKVVRKSNGAGSVWRAAAVTPGDKTDQRGKRSVMAVDFASIVISKSPSAGIGSYCVRVNAESSGWRSGGTQVSFTGDIRPQAQFSPTRYSLISGETSVACVDADLSSKDFVISFQKPDHPFDETRNAVTVWEVYKARAAHNCKGGKVITGSSSYYTPDWAGFSTWDHMTYTWDGQYCRENRVQGPR